MQILFEKKSLYQYNTFLTLNTILSTYFKIWFKVIKNQNLNKYVLS